MAIGKSVKRLAVGDAAHIGKVISQKTIYKIENAEVFIDEDGGFYLCCSSEWREYFLDPKAPIPYSDLKMITVDDLL